MTPRPKQPLPTKNLAPSATDANAIVLVKVWLLGISPMVWRRVLVSLACTLRELHGVLQVAMGWEGIHLYQFCLRAARYGSWELSVSPDVTHHRHRFPAELISHAVWLYHVFILSFREVELLLAERGVIVSYESIRQWCLKFGACFADKLRRRRPRPGDKWHLDEVFVRIGGVLYYLWRAVDQDGVVLDILIQSRRDAGAAKRFFKRLLKGLQYFHRVLRAHGQMNRRGRARPPRRSRPPTTHIASRPGAVWCWDVTFLPATVQGRWFYLYLILDLYSRKIVGFEVHDTDSADHAAHLARRTALTEGVHAMPVRPVLHGDNGATLKGTTVLALLHWLGIEPSYTNRPDRLTRM